MSWGRVKEMRPMTRDDWKAKQLAWEEYVGNRRRISRVGLWIGLKWIPESCGWGGHAEAALGSGQCKTYQLASRCLTFARFQRGRGRVCRDAEQYAENMIEKRNPWGGQCSDGDALATSLSWFTRKVGKYEQGGISHALLGSPQIHWVIGKFTNREMGDDL